MSTTILVAGASGALGREVVRLLRARGRHVRAMTRDAARARRALGPDVDTVVADARDPRAARAAVDGVEAVFSSLGASPLPDPRLGWRGFRAVDWPLNRNLVDAALDAGVKKVTYVSAFHTPDMRHLAYIDGHERVVDHLRAHAGDRLMWSVVRPTGFFSAIGSFLDMARRGPVPSFGVPDARTNPIHDHDLAEVCVEALDGDAREIPVGGPEVITRRRMAELAFEALGRPVRIRHVSSWILRYAAFVLRALYPRLSDCISFFHDVSSRDLIAPARGTRTLQPYFQERAKAV
jgi:uncharacterized protein YbjT (DUF2867 family)